MDRPDRLSGSLLPRRSDERILNAGPRRVDTPGVILLCGLALALATVPLLGGSFRGIDRAEFRGGAWIAVALAGQILVTNMDDSWIPRVGFPASITAAAVFVLLNRGRPGTRFLAWGVGLNLVAIVSNGGVMPASSWAWRVSGAPEIVSGAYANARPADDALLLPLGDVIPFPSGLPGTAPFSLGDVLLIIGFTVMIHHLCATTWAVRRVRRDGGGRAELWRWRHLDDRSVTDTARPTPPDPRTPSPV